MEENNKDGKKKSKFGRKELPTELKRNFDFNLTFNEAELKHLNSLFEKSGQKHFRPFLRELVISKSAKIHFQPEVNKELRIEIRRIGNNLNQIAHQLNLQFGPQTANEINKKIGQIEEDLKAILIKTEMK